MGDASPKSPGIRRSSLPINMQRQPASPSSVVRRPGTVPAGAHRGGGNGRTPEREDAPLSDARPGDLAALEQEEWVKVSWKKGECREEIKLIAEASGLTFDNARIVALRLYNHFNWLPQLQERAEQLLAVVGRERRLSLSLVRQEALAEAARDAAKGSTIGSSVGGRETCEAQDKAQGEVGETHGVDERHPLDKGEGSFPAAQDGRGGDTKDQFNRYIRGLCVICNEGSFDQMLDVLFRSYAVARNDGTISRREMAAILANHVVYDDSEDPTAEKERVYRWLKRQFIDLTSEPSSKMASETVVETDRQRGEPVTVAPYRDQDGGFISWDSARALLRRGPQFLENSIRIDLPCLSKDLWSTDVVDVGRTNHASPLQ